MTTIFAIITESGKESTLTPESNKDCIAENEYTSLQRTFLNLAEFIDDKNIISNTNMKHSCEVKSQLRVIGEKFSRKKDYKVITSSLEEKSLSSIAISVKSIYDGLNFTNKDAVILSCAGNYSISDRKNFEKYVKSTLNLAKEGYIVAFSFESDNVENGSIYLKTKEEPEISETNTDVLKVTGIIENKSNKIKKSNDKFYVNTGIYMFTPETFFSEIKKYLPGLDKIISKNNLKDIAFMYDSLLFEKFLKETIESAIIAKSKNTVTIKTENTFVETDLLYKKNKINKDKISEVDKCETVQLKEITDVEELQNKVMVITNTNVIITDKKTPEEIELLTENEINNANNIQRYNRPWGDYLILNKGKGYLTKCISVNPGQKLSLQLHHHRKERWYVLNGTVNAVKCESVYPLKKGDIIDIELEEIHSLSNESDKTARIFEIQQGDILDENDIVRLEDIYGRA